MYITTYNNVDLNAQYVYLANCYSLTSSLQVERKASINRNLFIGA